MKTIKMPIIEKKVSHGTFEVYTTIRDFIEGELMGLDLTTPIHGELTVADFYAILDSLQYYLALANEPAVLPIKYQVIDDSKLKEELKEKCQE